MTDQWPYRQDTLSIAYSSTELNQGLNTMDRGPHTFNNIKLWVWETITFSHFRDKGLGNFFCRPSCFFKVCMQMCTKMLWRHGNGGVANSQTVCLWNGNEVNIKVYITAFGISLSCLSTSKKNFCHPLTQTQKPRVVERGQAKPSGFFLHFYPWFEEGHF